MAQLYSNGKCYGPTPFFFQIRDMETHKVLAGIDVGDIGPKFGWNGKDNGYMKLTNVKRPYEVMAYKYLQVDSKGDFTRTGDEKMMYAGMMRVRTSLLSISYRSLATSLTVAVRYSYLRKQFHDADGKEQIIMNYQTQRARLFPLVAQTYAMGMALHEISDFVAKLWDAANNNDFSLLQEGHILLSAGKSFWTTTATHGIRECMYACGGHGYHAAGIHGLYSKTSANTIIEGENSVLYLQVAKFLLKNYQWLMQGKEKKITGSSAKYLLNADD
jgi:acyl-CoA oxidase